MELSKFERLVLLNQYRILEKVDPGQADSWARSATVIENGYTLEYEDLVRGFDEDVPLEVCQEVVQILDMFRMIQNTLRTADAKNSVDRKKAAFGGFDGNAGTGHYGYARFVIEEQGRWKDLKSSDLSSHWDTLPRYRAMLAEWKLSADPTDLTLDDVKRIVAAEE